MIATEIKTNAHTYNLNPGSGTSYEFHRKYPSLVITHNGTQHRIDVEQQIDELNRMEDGWLDGDGQALPENGLHWLRDQLLDNYPSMAPEIRLYPTTSGNVQAEWLINDHDISLEVNLMDHFGIWFDYDLVEKRIFEKKLNLDHSKSWKWIAARLAATGLR